MLASSYFNRVIDRNLGTPKFMYNSWINTVRVQMKQNENASARTHQGAAILQSCVL